MSYFDHEKLDVYRVAIQFNVLIEQVVEQLPRGRSYLADQLQRAGSSIPLNIAEGAGEYASNEKVRFYRIAKRSATECAAIFDLCKELKLIQDSHYMQGRELLLRIVAMLIRMAKGPSPNSIGHAHGHARGHEMAIP